MSSFLKYVIFMHSLLCICRGDYVTIGKKCSVNDNKCLASFYKNVIREVHEKGIPEWGIPPIDPLSVPDISISILKSLTASISNGSLWGISTCDYNDYNINLEKQIVSQDITCSLSVEGNLKLSGTSPEIEAMHRTAAINAQGKGKVQLDKLRVKSRGPFVIYKKGDNDIHMEIDVKAVKFTFDVQKATFSAEKILIGNDDISELGVLYINDNWRSLMKAYGNKFLETAIPIYYDIANKFFAGISLDKYIIEDLSSYVEN